MESKGLSGTTQLHAHRVLYTALKAAKRRKRIASNPCEDVDAPQQETKPINPPTADQVRKLIAAAVGTRSELVIKLLAHTGLRLGEALGLRWQDMDLDGGTFIVRQSRKQRESSDFGPTKTKQPRRIDLSLDLVQAFREHRSRQLQTNLDLGIVPSHDLAFTMLTHRGIEGLTHDAVAHDWKVIRERAGVLGVRLHDLRHFAARTMLAAGVPVIDVQTVLGHERASTTTDIYGHFIPGRGKAAVSEIEKALRNE